MFEDMFGRGLAAVGAALVICAFVFVTYLNSHDDRELQKARIEACAHQPNIAACIRAVNATKR